MKYVPSQEPYWVPEAHIKLIDEEVRIKGEDCLCHSWRPLAILGDNFGLFGAPATFQRLMDQMVKWTLAAEEAFGNLRRALCSKPVHTTPDFSKEFVVQADASEVGLGAVLSQINEVPSPQEFQSLRLFQPGLKIHGAKPKAMATRHVPAEAQSLISGGTVKALYPAFTS
eukprot:superscaffoldBa00000029_g565